jgi:hypothetical protein
MRRLILTTTAEAYVTEEWTLDAPDGLVVDEENALDVIAHPEEFGAVVVNVENIDVHGEHEREFAGLVEFGREV